MKKVGGFLEPARCFGNAILVTAMVFATLLIPYEINKAQALEAGDIVMELKPAEMSFTMVPGGHYAGAVTVSNIGRLDLHFNVSTRPYSASGENYEADYTTESVYTQLANWISFSQTNYELAPGESADVAFRITVPDDVASGGQYAVIIIETRDGIEEGSTIRQVSQLAGQLFGRVDGGDIRESGTVVEQKIPQIVLGQDLAVREVTRNTGNVDFSLNHTVSVVDFFTGKEVFGANSIGSSGQQIGSARQTIFPGTERASTLTWENSPMLGVYRVTETVSFLDQNFTYEQMVFIIPIWLVVLVGCFVGLMILWVILRIRRRRKSRPQVI